MASAPGGMEIIETKYVVWYIVGAAGDACDAGILILTTVYINTERGICTLYILQYKYCTFTGLVQCTLYKGQCVHKNCRAR